jgi:hypothetical protein
MKRLRLLIIAAIMLSVIGSIQTAEAQRKARHRGKRVVVVHRPHRTVVVRKAHVRYAGLPRWGTVVTAVPSGAVVVRSRRTPFYFHQGIYYTKRDNSFVIVRPARGIRVRILPVGYRTITVGPRNYYYYYGTFYTRASSSDDFVVVDAPEGAVVDALPDGYEIKTVNGKEYYEIDGVYFAEVDAPEFEDGIGYEVTEVN